MHYYLFEETVDEAFKTKSTLLETARCAGAYMRSCGLYISRGYDEILEANSLKEIGAAVVNHCSYYKEPLRIFKAFKMKKSSQKIVSIKQAKKALGKVRTRGCDSSDYLTVEQTNKMIRAQFKVKDAKKAVAKFWDWHFGQTGIIIQYTDGTSESGIYIWDIQAYLEMTLRGRKPLWD